jgi:hypothetical protein
MMLFFAGLWVGASLCALYAHFIVIRFESERDLLRRRIDRMGDILWTVHVETVGIGTTKLNHISDTTRAMIDAELMMPDLDDHVHRAG